MFYSQVILARKGPLGKIWLAAHFDKKLTKTQIFSTDISSSVESVLNPSTPLALRVSGHLMLGIVRIYSRKVKYLMSDATEAMWKIKLAFRPGNVDIDPNLAAALNIDDARYFGNLSLDNLEFPGLENTAFPQMLLSGYHDKRSSLINSSDPMLIRNLNDVNGIQDQNLNDYYLTSESPLFVSNAKLSLNHSDQVSSSRNSKASEIELMREERVQSIKSGHQRTSLSSLHGGRPSGISMSMSFDDDIPAFDENHIYDENYNSTIYTANPQEEVELLDLDHNLHLNEYSSGNLHLNEYSIHNSGNMNEDVEYPMEEIKVNYDDEIDEVISKVKPLTKNKRNVKKKRVLIDDRVELPNKIIKQRMADTGPILRRKVSDFLPFQQHQNDNTHSLFPQGNHISNRLTQTLEQRMNLPSSIRGLCSELQEVFQMSINHAPLPFPLKYGGIASSPQLNNSEILPLSDRRSSMGTVEITRAPRNSESILVGGRLSSNNEEDIEPFYGDESATDGGILSRYSDTMSRYKELEFGESINYNNVQDYQNHEQQQQQEDEGLMNFQSSPQNNYYEKPIDEFKSNSTDLKKYNEQRTIIPKTAVSELISDTFQRIGEKNNKSNISEEENNRTIHFMNILENEFSNKEVISFNELTIGVSKRVAASCFLETLQLKTWGRIQTIQDIPFGDIQLKQAILA